ncbi:hypothetical protein [Candidatus Methanoperedens nitratireducens]|uniref:Uncharacterized protein n=1 Tax=Candidatus Methanoperedens nitratireducens TaxID=1392998 RepID=A0A284VKC6_9EURY|nr:hypothetical protein [Candidatus Methanoperedens nitroreducens]SNQ59720.1 exported hypothetical protein [Candidatus Methanoperedens nitroreducens]
MVDKRNKNRTFMVSSLITLSVIMILIALVPANAVTISINELSGSIMRGDPKTFIVMVKMESQDKFVPISNITLSVNGPNTKNWTFNPFSGVLTNPPNDKNITIKVLSPPGSGSPGSGYGYGYGYDFGYGYNNQQGGKSILLTYQITLSTTDLTPGNYTATAYLNTGNPAKATFASSATPFTITSNN